jgi:hypothetical protein
MTSRKDEPKQKTADPTPSDKKSASIRQIRVIRVALKPPRLLLPINHHVDQ